MTANITTLKKGKSYHFLAKLQPLPANIVTSYQVIFELDTPPTFKDLKPEVTVRAIKHEAGYYEMQILLDYGFKF